MRKLAISLHDPRAELAHLGPDPTELVDTDLDLVVGGLDRAWVPQPVALRAAAAVAPDAASPPREG